MGDSDDGWIDESVDSNQNITVIEDDATGNHRSGSKSMRLTLDDSTGYISYKRTDYVVGKTYKASAWVKRSGIIILQMHAGETIRSETTSGSEVTMTSSYQEMTLQFVATNTTMYIYIKGAGTATHYSFLDDFTLVEGTDFTEFGAPNNNIGTIFCMNHPNGSSVPVFDSDNKAYAIDLGAGGSSADQLGLSPKGDNKIYCMGPELVGNGGFEDRSGDNFDDWGEAATGDGAVEAISSGIIYKGSISCRLTAASGGGSGSPTNSAYVSQNVNIKSGVMYRFNMWSHAVNSASAMIRLLRVDNSDPIVDINGNSYDDYEETNIGLTAASWNQYGFYFVGPYDGQVSVKITCPATNSAVVYIDDISIREVDLLTVEYNDALGSELITNGTMEADSNWAAAGSINAARTSSKKHSGIHSWTFEANSTYDGIQGDTYTTVTGKVYYYDLWVYPDDGTSIQVKTRAGNVASGDIVLSTSALTQDQWNNITGTYTETNGGTGAYISINSNQATSGVYYVDDVSVKEYATDNVTEGSSMYIRDDNTHFTDNATLGTDYKLDFVASKTGTNSNISVWDGAANASTVDDTYPTFDTHSIEITASNVETDYIRIGDSFAENEQIHIREMSYKHVGVSDGWTEADQQDTIPQTALMNGSLKQRFDGLITNGSYVATGAIGSGSSTYSISMWIFVERYGTKYLYDARTSSGGGLAYLAGSTLTPSPDGTGYVNGIQTTSGAGGVGSWKHIVVSGQTMNITDSLKIGRSKWGDNSSDRFKGIIDEVSLFNGTLTAAEVVELYNYGIPIDSREHSANNNLIGYWRNNVLTTDGKWEDLSKAENLSFDGNDDYLRVAGDYHDLRDNTDELTITAWVKYDTLTSNDDGTGYILGAGGWQHQFLLSYILATDNMRLNYQCGGIGTSEVDYYFTKTTDWIHVAVTLDSSNLSTLYVNGASVKTLTLIRGLYAVFKDHFQLGKNRGLSGSGDWFTGKSDQISTWSTALSGDDIATMYNSGRDQDYRLLGLSGTLALYYNFETENLIDSTTMRDLGPGNHHLTMYGGISVSDDYHATVYYSPDVTFFQEGITSGKGSQGFLTNLTHPTGGAVNLLGMDYIKLPNQITLKGDFSLEFWYKTFDSNFRTNSNSAVCSGYNNDQVRFPSVVSSGKTTRIYIRTNGGAYFELNIDSANQKSIYEWQHVVLLRDNGTWKVYIDSITTGNTTSNAADHATVSWTISHLFGYRFYEGTYHPKGMFDEFKVYDKALSGTEITKNYKHGLSKHRN